MPFKFEPNKDHIANEIQPIPIDWAKRPVVRVYNAKNELVVRTYGQTAAERLQAHLDGKCDRWCDHCYNEAMLTKGLPIDI